MARSTLYRRRQPVTSKPKRRPRPHRALDETEREEVLGALHCERFVDKAPAQVWATLLDEGTYLCSIRTMYPDFGGARRGPRAPEPTAPSELHQAGAVGRSAQPGLVVGYHEASWPRQVDLLLPLRHPRHLLPLRGWLDAGSPRKCGARPICLLEQRLIAESCRKQDIEPDQLTLHADRGSSMRSKPVGLLLADLGVTKTHSRPYDLLLPLRHPRHLLERQSLLRVSVQDDEVLSSVSEPLWFRRRRPAILLRFLRLLQFPPPALGNRPYDTGRRSLWSSRTAHHRSASDPSRSSTGSSRTLRSRNAATARFASAGLDQPAAGKNDAPRCRTSPSRGGVHTWGTPFFCFTQPDLGRC